MVTPQNSLYRRGYFLVILGYFPVYILSKSSKFFCSCLHCSHTSNFLLVGGSRRKLALFKRMDWPRFGFCMCFARFLVNFWPIFQDSRCKSLKLFLPTPSALANYALVFGRRLALNKCCFERTILYILDFMCVFAFSVSSWRIFQGFRCGNSKIFLLTPSALASYEFTFGQGQSLKKCCF